MTGKKTLTLTRLPVKRGVNIHIGLSLRGGVNVAVERKISVAYGTDETQVVGKNELTIPKHGFFAPGVDNFDGFPSAGIIEVAEDFAGEAYIYQKARITPTVTLKAEKGKDSCLAMYGNAYATDALFTCEHYISRCALSDNAVVRGGEHHEIWVEENGYVEGSNTDNVYVTGSARLINAGAVKPSVFGGDTEVNLTSLSAGEVNAATELLEIGALEWDLSKTQPLKSNKEHPRLLKSATPQNMWGTLDEHKHVWYLAHTAKALKEATPPDEVTMCLASTLHKKQREHCKCMFYYALYLLADPVALQYFARLEGNTLNAPTLLETAPYSLMEECMANRIIELNEACISKKTTGQAIFDENLTIPVEQVKQMRGFQRLVAELKNFNRPASFDDPTNEVLWYLNYLYVAHGITAEQFFSKGFRKDKPNKSILEMTARTRGII